LTPDQRFTNWSGRRRSEVRTCQEKLYCAVFIDVFLYPAARRPLQLSRQSTTEHYRVPQNSHRPTVQSGLAKRSIAVSQPWVRGGPNPQPRRYELGTWQTISFIFNKLSRAMPVAFVTTKHNRARLIPAKSPRSHNRRTVTLPNAASSIALNRVADGDHRPPRSSNKY
jgi:hypothetical protein